MIIRRTNTTVVDFSAAGEAEIESNVMDALNTAIPTSPTAGSINDAVRAITKPRNSMGKVYYVLGGESGVVGSDTNDGLSWGTAFATITKALTVAANYDTIYVGAGSAQRAYLEGATLNITQHGLKLIGVQTSGHQWGFPSIHTHGTETLIKVNAHEVEIAYLGIHHQGAGCGIEIGTTADTWRTHIHDCYFGGNGSALYGVVMGNTTASGVGTSSTVDAPCTIVENCFFGFFATAAVFMNCGYGSVVRNCVIAVGYDGGDAKTGIVYYTDSTSRPHGYILNNKFNSTDATNAYGISITNTPTAGFLTIDGNSFTNFADDDHCVSKRTGYMGVNYHNGIRMGSTTSSAQIKTIHSMDFWSPSVEEVQITSAAATLAAIATVTVADLPTGAVITRAIAMMKFRAIENIHATIANKLDGATVASTSQVIQVADDTPGTYYDAITFVDDQFGLAILGREGGDVIIGAQNLAGAGKVDANDGYIFRWLLSKADQDSINFNDCQFGLRIWYSLE